MFKHIWWTSCAHHDYLPMLFNYLTFLPLFVSSRSRRHKGERERKSDTKVWKPCFVYKIKFNLLYEGMVVLISGPVLARGEMMGAMQELLMVWCYWVLQSYCPGTGFGCAFKTPIAKTVYLQIIIVFEVKTLSSTLKISAFNFSMPIKMFFFNRN